MHAQSDIIKQIQIYLQTTNCTSAFVFGSFARGDADDESDIDIIVELPEPIKAESWQAIRANLESISKRKVDLFRMDRILRYAKEHIVNEAIRIYPK